MRIIFSRKGFDSSAGGGPSPIVEGKPVSLPIPAGRGVSRTTYDDLGLGQLASWSSRGKISGGDHCHHDPMFLPDGTCAFGQCSAAQTHLERQGVRAGDVFVFFGLFAEQLDGGRRGEPHHRIFGYLKIEDLFPLARDVPAQFLDLHHPHALEMHAANDCIWFGEGRTAQRASDALRLSVPGGPPSLWIKPPWLRKGELSYHDRDDRWMRGGVLRSVARGQEFVADIGRRKAPREWLDQIVDAINRS